MENTTHTHNELMAEIHVEATGRAGLSRYNPDTGLNRPLPHRNVHISTLAIFRNVLKTCGKYGCKNPRGYIRVYFEGGYIFDSRKHGGYNNLCIYIGILKMWESYIIDMEIYNPDGDYCSKDCRVKRHVATSKKYNKRAYIKMGVFVWDNAKGGRPFKDSSHAIPPALLDRFGYIPQTPHVPHVDTWQKGRDYIWSHVDTKHPITPPAKRGGRYAPTPNIGGERATRDTYGGCIRILQSYTTNGDTHIQICVPDTIQLSIAKNGFTVVGTYIKNVYPTWDIEDFDTCPHIRERIRELWRERYSTRAKIQTPPQRERVPYRMREIWKGKHPYSMFVK